MAGPAAEQSAPEGAGSEHFVIVFASQDGLQTVWSAALSHTFATWIEVKDKQIANHFTISWCAPIRVKLFAPAENGKNRPLDETIRRCLGRGLRVSMWGPYKVTAAFYANARRQFELLEAAQVSGEIKYKPLDGTSRFRDCKRAVNCMHAVSDTSGVTLKTGTLCGERASAAVVSHFKCLGLIVDRSEAYDWIWEAIRPVDCCITRWE